MDVIRIDKLKVEFNGVCVIEDVSFSVGEGEFLCLLGPSGAGKSTILRVIGGLLAPTAGTVRVHGQEPAQSWRKLAYVFQNPRLVSWRNALENVALGLTLRFDGVDRRTVYQRAEKYLRLVGLGNDMHKFPGMLSGGERQRVALVRALAVEPEIILMDEPFASLDVSTRERLRRETVEIWRATGKTIMFVTHDVDEALYLADRVLILSDKPSRILAGIPVGSARPRDVARDAEIRRLAGDIHGVLSTVGSRPRVHGEAGAASLTARAGTSAVDEE